MKKNDAFVDAILAAAIHAAAKKNEAKPKVDKDKIRKQTEDVGNAYYHVYLGFKDAGFNDTQAFQLLLDTINKGE